LATNSEKLRNLYYRARYYDPSAGRFASEDPIRWDGGINLYEYSRNKPVQLRDPLGRAPASPGVSSCGRRNRDCQKEYQDCIESASKDYSTCMDKADKARVKRDAFCALENEIPFVGPTIMKRCLERSANAYQGDVEACGSALAVKRANCLSKKTLCEMGF